MEVMDEAVLPAIALAKRELKNGLLGGEEERRLHESVFRVISGALPTAKLMRSPTSTAIAMVLGPVQAISIGNGCTGSESSQRQVNAARTTEKAPSARIMNCQPLSP